MRRIGPSERHTIGGLFEEQVRRRPDAVAILSGDRQLTYRELSIEAGRLAVRLRDTGVRRETLVAMAFERSMEAIVCTLGIVLAGGAYLPVNPAFPARRIARLLSDSRAPVLVVGAGAGASVSGAVPEGVRVLDYMAMERPVEMAGTVEPIADSTLAYVMYTSGSTGRPKGVMVEHRAVIRLVSDQDYFDFGEHQRILMTGALEFDAATFEIWGALLNGGVLVIVPQETIVTPWQLKNAVRANGITAMWLTAPLFNQLVDADIGVFAGLRTLLVGGDVLSCRHVNLLRAAHPELTVLNCYGPTENTTFTTVFRIDRPYYSGIPIGRPIRGTVATVLDEHGRSLPAGTVGELYVGGDGLARGYLHDPGQTAERFVSIGGVRHYRTGDLAKVSRDGVLSFHGRDDDQVKIRGHRVELPEIRTALLDVHGVLDAAVRVVEVNGAKAVAAYVVVADGLTPSGIRAAVSARVPAYLVPGRITLMDTLPLNANGKVDAGRLPASAPRRLTTARNGDAVGRLAAIWADLLGLDPDDVGPDDDFFELGGTSLTAGALSARIARVFGRAVAVGELLASRTLTAMAGAVSAAGPADPGTVVAVRAGAIAGPDLPVHPQQRALFAIQQMSLDSVAYNLPIRVDVRDGVEPARLRAAWQALIRRHEALRTRFGYGGDGVRQFVEPDAPVELDVVDVACCPTDDAAVDRLVRPFRLDTLPLARALLVRDPDRGDRLYLDAHHCVVDGVSLGILLGELFDHLAGTQPARPAVGSAAAIAWFCEQLAAGAFADAERYWLRRFAEPPPVLDLPTDHPRPPLRSTRGAVVRRALGRDRTARIGRLAGRYATTPFAVLLTGYVAALCRLTGQRDIVVGTPVSGRVHPDLEAAVGMFVNTVALRATPEPSATLGELLEALCVEHRLALTHQAYPFERLVRRLAVPWDPSRTPVFDAFFAWQNIDLHRMGGSGRIADVQLLHQGTCRFDLNLQAHDRPGGVLLELEYGTALLAEPSAGYLLDRVVDAVDELIGDGGRTVFDHREATPRMNGAQFNFVAGTARAAAAAGASR